MLLFLSSLLVLVNAANADCPGPFAHAAPYNRVCNPSGYDVCTVVGNTVTCHLTDPSGGADDYDTTSYYVSDSAGNFMSYGYEADTGAAYCCTLTVQNGCAGNQMMLYAYGSTHLDDMSLLDTGNGLAMQCSSSYVYGGYEQDTIGGSNLTSNHDYLYGEQDADTIHGRTGNDYIYGGTGPDKLYGEDGDDHIYGEDGDDQIKGGTGQDVIDGGNDNDDVCGGGGQRRPHRRLR